MASINLLGRTRRRKRSASGCIKANGRLKKGCRWAKGRKDVAIRVRRR